MSPLSVDPFGIIGLGLQLLSAGNQGRKSWVRNRRILKDVEHLVTTSGKLSRQEKERILQTIRGDTKLRQYIVTPKRIGNLQNYLLLLIIDEPALAKIAEPLYKLVETLAINENASIAEGLIHERILAQGDIQDETLTLVREQHEYLQKQRAKEGNPLGSMKDIAHDKFRGYGIRTISIDPDTRQSSIAFDKPFQLSLSGSGPTAHKLQRFKESVFAGEVASLEFTPEDNLHVKVDPPIMERFISLNFSKIEAKPTPQVVEQVIRYTVGDFSKAINTQIIFDRAARLFTFKLKTQQPSLKFEISWNSEGKQANFTISVSTGDGQRPNISDLSVLHLISQLNNGKQLLDLSDEGSGSRFASIDLPSSQPSEDLMHLSDLAYLTALYLEANHELLRAQIIDDNLPWPADDDWNDPERKLTGLFERIRDVLKHKNKALPISGKATLVEIYEDAPDANIKDGILEGNMTIGENVSFGKHLSFTQYFTFDNPQIRLWQNGEELKTQTIREAFLKYGTPIILELQDDQTIVSFAKENANS